MGWANCHLHQFIIHGKEYGVAYEGGISFADNPDKVRLSDFRFQPHEGFEYVYDLGDNWERDIRVEKILALDPARAYPVCIGGAQPCPSEDSGGPWRYMSLRRTKKPHREHRKTRSPGKAKDIEDQFDPDGVNFLSCDGNKAPGQSVRRQGPALYGLCLRADSGRGWHAAFSPLSGRSFP